MARDDWRISPREFEKLVEEAVAELPQGFLDMLDNVVIIVEEEPSEEDLDDCEIGEDDDLLGVYRGIPLGDRGFGSLDLPDQIAIFRGPILRLAVPAGEAEPVVILEEDAFVAAESLLGELEHLRKWPVEHWHLGFQGQLRTVSEADADLLADRMRAAAAVPTPG